MIKGRSMAKDAQVAQATGHMQVKDPLLPADAAVQLALFGQVVLS